MNGWDNMMDGWSMNGEYMTLFTVLLIIIAVAAVISLFRR